MSIQRLHTESRYSEVVIHNGTVYLAGQLADDFTQSSLNTTAWTATTTSGAVNSGGRRNRRPNRTSGFSRTVSRTSPRARGRRAGERGLRVRRGSARVVAAQRLTSWARGGRCGRYQTYCVSWGKSPFGCLIVCSIGEMPKPVCDIVT